MILRLFFFYTTAFLQGCTSLIIPGASSIFKLTHENNISDFRYGLLSLGMIGAAILSSLTLNRLVKLWGQVKIYQLGLLANLIFSILILSSYYTKGNGQISFILFLLGSAFLGCGIGFLISILNLYMVKLVPEKKDTFLTGMHASISIGAGAMPFFIFLGHTYFSWQDSLIILIFAFCLLLFLAPKILGDLVNKEEKKGASLSQAKDKSIYIFFFIIFLYALIETLLAFWSTDYLQKVKYQNLETSLKTLSIFWWMVAIGRILASLVSLRLDAKYLYLFSPFLLFFAFFLLVSQNKISPFYLYALLGLGCSYFFPLSISLGTRTFPFWEEKLASLSTTILMVGIGFCNVSLGHSQSYGYLSLKNAFIINLGIIFLLIISVYIFFRGNLKYE